MNKKHKILSLITEIRNSHPMMEKVFLYGSCMNLFCILRADFPTAQAYYNSSHVITKIDGTYYDITGVVTSKGYLPFGAFYNKRRTSRAFTQMYNAAYLLSYDSKSDCEKK